MKNSLFVRKRPSLAGRLCQSEDKMLEIVLFPGSWGDTLRKLCVVGAQTFGRRNKEG